ncbi:MAG TPA: GNAT family N-acetyltransferase [Roseiflexaceae bacterium]
MHLFRRNLDLGQASPREATADDLTAISRLLRSSTRRYIGFPSGDLPALLAGAPSMLLVADADIWAAAIGGWQADSVIWLRGLALANSLPVGSGLDSLLPPFHALLRSRGLRTLFYAGDEATDVWLQPALTTRGYVGDTEVVVYEKRGMETPSEGNRAVRVRRAQAVDLPTVLAIDRACFAPQWNKDEGILGPSLIESPHFIIAELDGAAVGYAFVTTHFASRLVHLVRIAVLPACQGQAIGVRLLAEVVAYARSIGAESLTLNTQVHNAPAQRLYEWFGFRRTGEQQMVLRFDL